MSKKKLRYRVGVDVGLYSVGLSAIEIDDSSDNPYEAMPLKFLSMMSVIHDGAIDPSTQKADSRKNISGTARRARRMFKYRKKRYGELDTMLEKYGFPVAKACEMVATFANDDPYLPWRVRAELVEDYIEDADRRMLMVAIAARHIARHRGWKNPYSEVSALKNLSKTPSSFYKDVFDRQQIWRYNHSEPLWNENLSVRTVQKVSKRKTEDIQIVEGVRPWENEADNSSIPTIAQLIKPMLTPKKSHAFRSESHDAEDIMGFHLGTLHQSDYYAEFKRICSIQKISDEASEAIANSIFSQVNPRDVGAAAELVGKDDLQPTKSRALKASLSFQQYRILTTLANLRIKQNNSQRCLDVDEKQLLFDWLSSEEVSLSADNISWHDVADKLGVDRNELKGVGGETADGLPISAKQPPILTTEKAVLTKKVCEALPTLITWWNKADLLSKEFFIESLSNSGMCSGALSEEEKMARSCVEDLYAELGKESEESLQLLDEISLAFGRAAYSLNTLMRLNNRMLNEGLDLFEARKVEFRVDDDWQPSPNPLGTPTGNPAADRTIKIVSRWLKACERQWGAPETVFIETMRDGFKSKKQKQKQKSKEEFENNQRYKANNKVRDEIIAALAQDEFKPVTVGREAIRHFDIRRHQAIQRQNNECLYCGESINFRTAQMDHIVPRKGPGCSNELSNLVACCADCNKKKNHTLFSRWAGPDKINGVLERVDSWNRDSYFSSDKQFEQYKRAVKSRLTQTEEDEPLDSRSKESVAWMARELKSQVEGYFGYKTIYSDATKSSSVRRVLVFGGSITSEARRASGLEQSLPWIGSSNGKTRLDRRHHAVDAAVIAFLRPSVAATLAERESMHKTAQSEGAWGNALGNTEWKEYEGKDFAQKTVYQHWKDNQMGRLQKMLKDAMAENRIIVTNPLRLRLSVGKAHDSRIRPFTKLRVGNRMSAVAIDKAETPALWMALTSHPDYSKTEGLPEDWSRCIRVHDRWLEADDKIKFMAETKDDLDEVKSAVCLKVGSGFAQVGDTLHHTRLYRIPKYNKMKERSGCKFAQLRVYQADLLKHSNEDLFSASLSMNSISIRSAVSELRDALEEGIAEYLGWLVVGDELVFDTSAPLLSAGGKQRIDKFMRAFPNTTTFVVKGFGTNSKILIAPRMLASEGLPDIAWEEEPEKEPLEDFSEEIEPATNKKKEKEKKTRPKDEREQKKVERCYGSFDWTKKDIDDIRAVIEKGVSLVIDKVLSSQPTVMRRDALGRPRWSSNNNMPVCWKIPPSSDE